MYFSLLKDYQWTHFHFWEFHFHFRYTHLNSSTLNNSETIMSNRTTMLLSRRTLFIKCFTFSKYSTFTSWRNSLKNTKINKITSASQNSRSRNDRDRAERSEIAIVIKQTTTKKSIEISSDSESNKDEKSDDDFENLENNDEKFDENDWMHDWLIRRIWSFHHIKWFFSSIIKIDFNECSIVRIRDLCNIVWRVESLHTFECKIRCRIRKLSRIERLRVCIESENENSKSEDEFTDNLLKDCQSAHLSFRYVHLSFRYAHSSIQYAHLSCLNHEIISTFLYMMLRFSMTSSWFAWTTMISNSIMVWIVFDEQFISIKRLVTIKRIFNQYRNCIMLRCLKFWSIYLKVNSHAKNKQKTYQKQIY